MKKKNELSYRDLKMTCDTNLFHFETTEELEPISTGIGQERGIKALEFGVNVNVKGYNIYIEGHSGIGKTMYTKNYLDTISKKENINKELNNAKNIIFNNGCADFDVILENDFEESATLSLHTSSRSKSFASINSPYKSKSLVFTAIISLSSLLTSPLSMYSLYLLIFASIAYFNLHFNCSKGIGPQPFVFITGTLNSLSPTIGTTHSI